MSHAFRCVVAALLAATPSLLTAQQKPVSGPPPSAAALTALVDSVVRARLLTQGVPSVSVTVVRGGETLVQRAWGRADVASGRPADPSTLYAIASNSKQFTAALVLRLVDRGRLTLGDSIGRHLSGLRPEWRAITIEQLLNHTSGLQRSFVDLARIGKDLPGDSLIAQAARDTMAARPGATFLYSNTGYMLLGVLVEKLYGKPYAAALRDEIARPLGLATLRSCAEVEAGGRATGYDRAFDGTLSPPPALHPSQQLGSGGICSTAADLAKWNRALHGGRVLSGASYRAMTTPRGAAIPAGYGFGLSVRPAPWGGPAITHGGQDVGGFVSENGWYPADSLSVTILYDVYPRVADVDTHVIAALAL
ncbi:MAG: serine hydrolase domain-containing protein, partial [Longimicrobiaceae bacterium]